MKKMHILFGIGALALATGLTACGEESSSSGPSGDPESSRVSTVESENDLPNCTDSRDGTVRFIKGTKEGFICLDRKWVYYGLLADVEDNLPGCIDSRNNLIAYLYEENRALVCWSGAWESIKDESEFNPMTQTLRDPRDGQVYKTVTIGTQTWMAENLNYDYNYGSAKSYCYDDDPDNCGKYGRLYLWSAAMDSAAVFSTDGRGCGYGYKVTCSTSGDVRGVCPEGWHLPSYEEWLTLLTAVGGDDIAGKMLKSTSGWYDGGDGTDVYGFSALPAGSRYRYGGHIYYEGGYAYFWSATQDENNRDIAYYMRLGFFYDNAYLDPNNKDLGYSVRCLQN